MRSATFEAQDFFDAGTSIAGFAEQTIALTPAQLAATNPVVVFGGRVRSIGEVAADRGQITLTFLNASGVEISHTTAIAQNVTDRWELVGGRLAIPGRDRAASASGSTASASPARRTTAFSMPRFSALILITRHRTRRPTAIHRARPDRTPPRTSLSASPISTPTGRRTRRTPSGGRRPTTPPIPRFASSCIRTARTAHSGERPSRRRPPIPDRSSGSPRIPASISARTAFACRWRSRTTPASSIEGPSRSPCRKTPGRTSSTAPALRTPSTPAMSATTATPARSPAFPSRRSTRCSASIPGGRHRDGLSRHRRLSPARAPGPLRHAGHRRRPGLHAHGPRPPHGRVPLREPARHGRLAGTERRRPRHDPPPDVTGGTFGLLVRNGSTDFLGSAFAVGNTQAGIRIEIELRPRQPRPHHHRRQRPDRHRHPARAVRLAHRQPDRSQRPRESHVLLRQWRRGHLSHRRRCRDHRAQCCRILPGDRHLRRGPETSWSAIATCPSAAATSCTTTRSTASSPPVGRS